jgi:uncharacterized protein (DUF433 family)
LTTTLTPNEVAALSGLDERRVRKDVEYGFFGSTSPPRFELPALVYFRTLAEFGFDLGVEDRKKLYTLILDALKTEKVPASIELSPIAELKLGKVVREVESKLDRFEAWKKKLVTSPDILGGEPVFPKSRLAVRHVGGMVLRGASTEEIREDYPYLKDEDIECAKLYTEAYPRVGRPREREAAPR